MCSLQGVWEVWCRGQCVGARLGLNAPASSATGLLLLAYPGLSFPICSMEPLSGTIDLY